MQNKKGIKQVSDAADTVLTSPKRGIKLGADWIACAMAMARGMGLQAEPELAHVDYCDCLERVFAGLRRWRLSQSNPTRSSGTAAPLG